MLSGRPEGVVRVMPEPEALYLPLRSRRFTFNEVAVKDGQHVNGGDILARDIGNYAVPLLAPRAGVVRLNKHENHIVIEDVAKLQEHADVAKKEMAHIEREMGAGGIKRYKLLALGAWEFFDRRLVIFRWAH